MNEVYEAEISVVGALLIDSSQCIDVLEILTPDDFEDEKCKATIEAMIRIKKDGKPIDVVTVLHQMNGVDQIKSFLVSAAEYVPSVEGCHTYADIVKNASHKRLIRNKLLEVLQNITPTADSTGIICDAENAINSAKQIVLQPTSKWDFTEQAIQYIQSVYNPDNDKYIKTGIYDLDNLIYGLPKGEVIGVAARPRVGKTTYALNLAYHLIQQKRKVLFVTLEMSDQQVIEKLVSIGTTIKASALQRKTTTDGEKSEITQFLGTLSDNKLLEIMPDGYAVSSIIKKAKAVEADVVIIDYLQYMHPAKPNSSRNNEIDSMSRDVKFMAKKLNVPVVLLSQLNRGLEARANKYPLLSDLRESGAIEQDLAICIFLHREGLYNKDISLKDLDVIVAKNRFGRTGALKFLFELETQQIKSLDKVHDDVI